MQTDLPELSRALGQALSRARATLATAESCTGGLLAKLLTDVPGSSAYFLAGFVAYSNKVKLEVLGVDDGLLREFGAVSAEVAAAMAAGCLDRSGADHALSTTGIAGPTGCTPEKPVGLVYVGLAAGEEVDVCELQLDPGLGREGIREDTARFAFQSLLERLQ